MNAVVEAEFSEVEFRRSICKQSFYEFVREFWGIIIDEAPVWNWHIEVLCEEMQIVAERVFANKPKAYDLVINVPPGSTKSTICSIMFPAWAWTRKPASRFICGSYAMDLAIDLSLKCRDIILSEKYQELFPGIQLRKDQKGKGSYHNSKKGMRMSTSAGGVIVGRHAHFLLVDDPIDPNAALSEPKMKEVNRWMVETLPQRKVDSAITPLILIQQRLHQDDPSGQALELSDKKPIRHICLPAELSDDVSPINLRLNYDENGLLDPVRLSSSVLAEKKLLGTYVYSAQFQQRATPPGGGTFKVARFQIDYPHEPIVKSIRYWDKAGLKDAGCYTAGVLMAKDRSGKTWILDIVRGQWASEEREKIIRQTAELDGHKTVVWIEQEPGSGGLESAEATIRNLEGYLCFKDVPKGDKIFRADPFSVQVNNGNIYLKKDSEWIRDFIEECRFFPFSKYKDQVDAAGGAHAKLVVKKTKVGGLGVLGKPKVYK